MKPAAGWSAQDIVRITGGSWLTVPTAAGWSARGVCADASQFGPGQMLLAPSLGAGRGAGLPAATVARLASRSSGIIAEDGSPYARSGVPVLEVPDLRQCVTRLASAARHDFNGIVLAVTGSVGKTTTVAMAHLALSGCHRSDRSRTSANSPYGIAWNLASMDRSAQSWVQEMSAGRMNETSQLVQPGVAIVTAIAPAHLEDFGTTDNIARLKARIYVGMKPGGIAVINRDMVEFPIFQAAALAAKLRVVCFGSTPDCDAQVLAFDGHTLQAVIMGKKYSFALGAAGDHMAMNAVAVLAAVAALDLDVATAARQLARFQPLAGRGQRTRVTFEGRQIDVWDDSYNANPGSMRAALRTMQGAASVPPSSRVLILGDMLELGPDAHQLHLSLEQDIRAAGPDRVLLCGPLMQGLADKLLGEVKGRWFADVTAMQAALSPWIHENDTVLIKASHGTRLGNIVKMLTTTPNCLAPAQRQKLREVARATETPPRPFQRHALPQVEARSAISVLVCQKTGKARTLLFAKATDLRVPPASLVKLMTSMVMLDLVKKFGLSLSQALTIEEVDSASGSGRNLKTGERVTVRDALANLLLPSSNLTANAVARTFGQLLCGVTPVSREQASSRFIAAMQLRAAQLGMRQTQFHNASGLPARGQLTSAADVARLMMAALQYPEIVATWGKPSHVLRAYGARSTHQPASPSPAAQTQTQAQSLREQEIRSTVKVISDYDVTGGKTGTLLPGCHHVAILSKAPNGDHIVTAIMSAPDQLSLYTDLRHTLDAVKRGRDWPEPA